MKRILYVCLLLLFFVSNVYSQEKVADKIYSVNIDRVITNITYTHIEKALKKAEMNSVPLLINIDTPGGILDSTRKMVSLIIKSSVPVIAYVGPEGARASSAGSFIVLASDFAVMNSYSSMGASHPVDINGGDIEGTMGDKVLNDTVSLVKYLAEKRGRNIEPAVAMVKDSVSYTAKEAINNGLVNSVVDNEEQFKKIISDKYNLASDFTIEEVENTFTDNLLNMLADPDILTGLLFIGTLLILLEIKLGGTFIFGILGVLFFILFGTGANIIPVNVFGILLIAGAFGLFVAEMFITSFGILGIGGIISLITGLNILFDSSNSQGVEVSIWLKIIIVLIFFGIMALLSRLVFKDMFLKPSSGPDTMLGKTAVVESFSNGEGTAKIYEEIWNIESEDELSIGEKVTISAIEGLKLKVKKIK